MISSDYVHRHAGLHRRGTPGARRASRESRAEIARAPGPSEPPGTSTGSPWYPTTSGPPRSWSTWTSCPRRPEAEAAQRVFGEVRRLARQAEFPRTADLPYGHAPSSAP
ncbi:MAG: hypothetical protein M0C28_48570 [Candidatus Moduliflexus flocculans]|nr:hypothetical protein [Candidatus Moduliflexus flocculans]